MLHLIITLVVVFRVLWIAYCLIYPLQLTLFEVFILARRCAFVAVGIFVLSSRWNDEIKPTIGVGLLWSVRTVTLMIILHQVFAKVDDHQHIAGIFLVHCLVGIAIPRFAEYLCAAFPLVFIRPLFLHLAGIPADQIQEVIFQNALIFALGLSITWTMHSDYRRDWLCRRAAAVGATARGRRQKTARQPRPAGSSGGASAAEPGGWDMLDDGDFADAESAELREQALQARRPSP